MKCLNLVAVSLAVLSSCVSGWRVEIFEKKDYRGKALRFKGTSFKGETPGNPVCIRPKYQDGKKEKSIGGIKSVMFSDQLKSIHKSCCIWAFKDGDCKVPGAIQYFDPPVRATCVNRLLDNESMGSLSIVCYSHPTTVTAEIDKRAPPKSLKNANLPKKTFTLNDCHNPSGCGLKGGECENYCQGKGTPFDHITTDGCFGFFNAIGAGKCCCKHPPPKWVTDRSVNYYNLLEKERKAKKGKLGSKAGKPKDD